MTVREEYSDLLARINILERRGRRLQAALCLLLVMFALGILVAAGPARRGNGPVQAERFVLVDWSGVERARWCLEDDMPCFVLNDRSGKPVIQLAQQRDGAEVAIYDGAHRKQLSLLSREDSAALSLQPNGGAATTQIVAGRAPDGDSWGSTLTMKEGNAEPLVLLNAAHSEAALALSDGGGKGHAMLSQSETGGPFLGLHGKAGMVRVAVDLIQDKVPALELVDPRSVVRAKLLSMPAQSGLALFDAEGKTRAMFGVTPVKSVVALHDERGKARIKLVSQREGPAISLEDPQEHARLLLATDESGSAISLIDGNGCTRAAIGITPDRAALIMRDEKEQQRANLAIKRGVPGVIFVDENGYPLLGPSARGKQ